VFERCCGLQSHVPNVTPSGKLPHLAQQIHPDSDSNIAATPNSLLNAATQSAAQATPHEGPIQKIPWKPRLNFADLVQLRKLLRVQRPVHTIEIVL